MVQPIPFYERVSSPWTIKSWGADTVVCQVLAPPLQNCFTDTYTVHLLSNYSAPWVLRRPMLFDTCPSSKRVQRTRISPSSCLLKVLRPLIQLAVDAVPPIGGDAYGVARRTFRRSDFPAGYLHFAMPLNEHRPSTTPGTAQPQLRLDADCIEERAQQHTSPVVQLIQL